MTNSPDKAGQPEAEPKKPPEPRRPGGKTKRIAVTAALILFALLLLALLLPVCACAQTITGKVVGVTDGDAITCPRRQQAPAQDPARRHRRAGEQSRLRQPRQAKSFGFGIR